MINRPKTVKSLGEFALIERLERLLPKVARGLGIGDDCAVLPIRELGLELGQSLVTTTDAGVENRHFMRSWPGRGVGEKLIGAAVSDIAAMGAYPLHAVLALTLPEDTEIEWLEEVYRGIAGRAEQLGFDIVGGNISSGAELSITTTVTGVTYGEPKLRSGASAGDDLWMSGPIGGSYLGLQYLLGREPRAFEYESNHLAVRPRLDLAELLSQYASALLDISDGLIQDASHLARSSRKRLILNRENILIAPGFADLGIDPARALTSGEDYELLCSASPSNRVALELAGMIRIGEVAEGEGVFIRDGLVERPAAEFLAGAPGGFQHFSVEELSNHSHSPCNLRSRK